MSQITSPFKFLDSYSFEDADIFFGRERETEALYDALSGVKHLLVYGPSGVGKTSLIECGLRNHFSPADWYALTIRKGDNIVRSVFAGINRVLKKKIELHPETKLPVDKSIGFGKAIDHLIAERYRPIYLLFDQFEELLISGEQAEKEDFFKRLDLLIHHPVPCRVMLIMREEFIGHLSEFEPLCPSIFQHRFRLEKMRKESVKEIIRKTLDAPKYATSFAVEDSEGLAASILSKLPDKKREIELAHVQVFLSELWDRAHKDGQGPGALPMLRQSLINEEDNLEGVLDSFLKKQLKELEAVHGEKIPLEVLAAMISERHTKLQVSEEDLKKDLQDEGIALPKDLPLLLRDLETRRIIRTLRADEKTKYEISHDVLALVVGKRLTPEMQQREEAARVYKVYEGKQGNLSPEDLDHIRSYQLYKALPVALKKKVEESVANNARKDAEKLEEAQRQAEQERKLRGKAEEKERQARQRTGLAAGISIVALALAFFAGWSFFQADAALSKLEKANISTCRLILKDASRNILYLQYEDALKNIKSAANLEVMKDQVTETWLEIAFWYGEIGNTQRAIALIDSLADFSGKKVATKILDSLPTDPTNLRNRLRDAMMAIDYAHFQYLFIQKYYPEMVPIEGGKFKMGCDGKNNEEPCKHDETPFHFQEISPFEMSKYETTVWQFSLYRTTSQKKGGDSFNLPRTYPGNYPIMNVNWYEAVKYANWVSEQKNIRPAYSIDNEIKDPMNLNISDTLRYKVTLNTQADGFRLPTEAEWEFSAKVTKLQGEWHCEFSGSNNLDEVGWYSDNSQRNIHPVGSMKANDHGLFDMSGNVWEWCWDWYGKYQNSPDKDYLGPEMGEFRVMRGGSWSSERKYCRIVNRGNNDPDVKTTSYGFRLSRTK